MQVCIRPLPGPRGSAQGTRKQKRLRGKKTAWSFICLLVRRKRVGEQELTHGNDQVGISDKGQASSG